MIDFSSVTFTYPGTDSPQVRDARLTIPEGDLALVVGPTGSGKSTLLGLVNGLVPHFTGGTLHGDVTVAGRSTKDHPPREMADLVGVVRQDPQTGFVTDMVEDELAYTMESLAVAPDVMRRRVEDTLDLLGLAALRDRPLRTLSGGERQRVAIGSVLTAHPRVLVLDEPTSALDPQAAEEVIAAVQRLVHDLGLTVLMSEHRLERVVQFADSVVTVLPDGAVNHDPVPSRAMRAAPVRPPIVELGLLAGWDPLPLSIRDARRRADPLRRRLLDTDGSVPASNAAASQQQVDPNSQGTGTAATERVAPTARRAQDAATARAHRVSLAHSDRPVLRQVDLEIPAGQIVALMGRNGAGKTTLLNLLSGSATPDSGRIRVLGQDPAALKGRDLVTRVGYVPQEPGVLLWAESVAAECAAADSDTGSEPGAAQHVLADLQPGIDPASHPGDLSEGSRLALALALILAADPDLLLLDEPTRGLDYPAKHRLADILRRRRERGRSAIVATHDVELAAEVCDRVVILADGDVVVDAGARSAVTSSPVFAPQTAKILAPLPLLTVAEARAALARVPTSPEVLG